ncbi:D-glycero-beta-D-manno-heptose 1,7-bisphosphate 7-phosphatase [Geobacter argillaceus]|uniref:D,D-heptose 1,7-bisphosphate phosphatase n=1 Tax=Geobacter argillaceus TaxID=345631 RepID=A0A562VNT5_9BACT|nr:D-glycero-beta-D-manno-heptose 1,7-bisphosphate 7-phosphatase [Geobacter argillaceus]TWJ19441.1 D-alpha,beta-D-heptose 1,7-bisphosphate phosphatase [Geobacter argillaceus]
MRGEDLRRAVFLDRDGTINEERVYLHRVEEFAFIPGVPEVIRDLRRSGFLVIVVTNQSGIGRGYYDEAALARLHAHMDSELARVGAAIDAYYFCPHHPEHGVGDYRRECDCRKPLPGMLLTAAREWHVDLGASYLVGDKLADVEAALAAGCRPVLVRTGYGVVEALKVPPGVPVCDDLPEAARMIVLTA